MKSPAINRRLRIWEATYAAAFVNEFKGRRQYADFDTAIQGCCETAITIADAAVNQLAEWIAQEGPESMGR